MLTGAFDGVGAAPGDYYPEPLRPAIDALNERIYDGVNNGVYKAGFATSQAAYDEAVAGVFETLDWLDAQLSRQRYVTGDQLTEADIRLFTTLVRFAEVYRGTFQCNVRRIADYPSLWGFTRDPFQFPGMPPPLNTDHIKPQDPTSRVDGTSGKM